MNIRLSELRRIIRDTLNEQGVVPGSWGPGSGDPATDEDVESMGKGGLGHPPDELDEIQNAGPPTVNNLKRSDIESISKKWPRFISSLRRSHANQMKDASFAISGGKIPIIALKRGDAPVAYWQADPGVLKYSTSDSLAAAVENAQ